MGVRQQWIYRNGALTGYQDWFEPSEHDEEVAKIHQANYPPSAHVAPRDLLPGEIAFDHIPTASELAAAFKQEPHHETV